MNIISHVFIKENYFVNCKSGEIYSQEALRDWIKAGAKIVIHSSINDYLEEIRET